MEVDDSASCDTRTCIALSIVGTADCSFELCEGPATLLMPEGALELIYESQFSVFRRNVIE